MTWGEIGFYVAATLFFGWIVWLFSEGGSDDQ